MYQTRYLFNFSYFLCISCNSGTFLSNRQGTRESSLLIGYWSWKYLYSGCCSSYTWHWVNSTSRHHGDRVFGANCSFSVFGHYYWAVSVTWYFTERWYTKCGSVIRCSWVASMVSLSNLRLFSWKFITINNNNGWGDIMVAD